MVIVRRGGKKMKRKEEEEVVGLRGKGERKREGKGESGLVGWFGGRK